MPKVTLSATVDADYADTGDAPSNGIVQHQRDHRLLHERFNNIVHLDDYGSGVKGDGTDDKAELQAIINACASIGTGPMTKIVGGDRPYGLSGALNLDGKAVIFEGMPGFRNAGGKQGSRFVGLANTIDLLDIGNGTTIVHQGPIIKGWGFDAGVHSGTVPNTNVKAVKINRQNRVTLDDCWFGDLDFGIELLGASGGGDNAWHTMRKLKFYYVGSARSSGGAYGIQLGDSYGATLWEDIEFIVSSPSSGFNNAILATNANGCSSHHFVGLWLDGGASGDNTKGVLLTTAKHCHFSHVKAEQMGTIFTFDGDEDLGSGGNRFGRGNSLSHASITSATNGIVINAGAGATDEGGSIDHIAYENISGTKRTVSIPAGFKVGIELTT